MIILLGKNIFENGPMSTKFTSHIELLAQYYAIYVVKMIVL